MRSARYVEYSHRLLALCFGSADRILSIRTCCTLVSLWGRIADRTSFSHFAPVYPVVQTSRCLFQRTYTSLRHRCGLSPLPIFCRFHRLGCWFWRRYLPGLLDWEPFRFYRWTLWSTRPTLRGDCDVRYGRRTAIRHLQAEQRGHIVRIKNPLLGRSALRQGDRHIHMGQ